VKNECGCGGGVVVVVINLDAQSNVSVCLSSFCPQRGEITNEQTFARQRRLAFAIFVTKFSYPRGLQRIANDVF
jgi:hypothetical protein